MIEKLTCITCLSLSFTIVSYTGPTALVQFNIWERGDVDMIQLRELLVKAMKHAACDVVMEYQLLTAPLCEVPLQPLTGLNEPQVLSATASPKVDTPGMNL